jgi:hypothetical protein
MAMPRHSKSAETRPKKRRKTVEFEGDPEESIPVDDDKEARPELPEDTAETESAEARYESYGLSISHSNHIEPSNMPHCDVLWVGNLVATLMCVEPKTEGDLVARISTQ